MLCVPGNHDVGDASGEAPFDAPLLAAYVRQFGPDHWAHRAGDWLLLGVNAQLMGSGTTQEQAQWRWIEQQAGLAGAQTRTLLFLHRPVLRSAPGEAARKGRYVPGLACDRLLNGALRHSLRMVVSGHTHQHLDTSDNGVRHVWVPSTGFILPDHMQPRLGEKVVGIGLLDLQADGAAFDLWCPDGMLRHQVSELQAFQTLVAVSETADTH